MAWKKAETYSTARNILLSDWGLAKVGKTTGYAGLTKPDGEIIRGFPAPMYVLNTDQGLNELLWTPDKKWRIDPALQGRINVSDVVMGKLNPTFADKERLFNRAWADIDAAYRELTEDANRGGTMVFDTMSKFWPLWTDVQTQQEADRVTGRSGSEVMQFMWKVPNANLTNLILAFKEIGANVVFIHHAKQVYRKNERGKLVAVDEWLPQDANLMDQLVQIQVYRRAQDYTRTVGGKETVITKHYGRFDFNRWDETKRGREYQDLDYAMIYSETFGEEAA